MEGDRSIRLASEQSISTTCISMTLKVTIDYSILQTHIVLSEDGEEKYSINYFTVSVK